MLSVRLVCFRGICIEVLTAAFAVRLDDAKRRQQIQRLLRVAPPDVRRFGQHRACKGGGQPFRPEDPAYLADFDRLMASTSLVILDLKEIDPERHRRLTGKDNANILAMARHVSDLGVPLWIRHVLVPGLTDDEDGLRRTADFIRSLNTVQRVEVLPYHTLGLFKWQKLGIPYPLPDAVPPTPEQVKRAEELLQVQRYPG